MRGAMKSLDLTKVPRPPWSRIAYLLGGMVPDMMAGTAEWIESEYPNKDELDNCITFLHIDLLEAVPGDLTSLGRVWYFPWAEASSELELSLAFALMSFHRSAFDHQRRALELVAVGSYFLSQHVTQKQARDWYSSVDQSPFLTRAIDKLASGGFPARLDQEIGWVADMKKFYWGLSDIVHVRGTEYGSDVIQPVAGRFSGLPVPRFDPKSLTRALDSYRATTQHVATLLVAANPIVTHALPMDEKFGLGGPMSGFFQETAVERLRLVLGEARWERISAIAADDPGVQSLRESIENLPDLTEEDWKQQVEAHKAEFGPYDT